MKFVKNKSNFSAKLFLISCKSYADLIFSDFWIFKLSIPFKLLT